MIFNFTESEKLYKEGLKNKNKAFPNTDFLCWFIGFSEGAACFTSSKSRSDLQFVVSQSCTDLPVLNYILDNLGFGHISKQGPRVSRYIVQDKVHLRYIIEIFNGNLVLPSRKKVFKTWLQTYNKRFKTNIIDKHFTCFASNEAFAYEVSTFRFAEQKQEGSAKDLHHEMALALQASTVASSCNASICFACLQSKAQQAFLENSWLCGFTDAEGCFTASFLKNSSAFRLRYIVSQKGSENLPVLSAFILTFSGGSIEKHSKPGNYSYILSGCKNVVNLFPYFDKFPLRSKKKESFVLWKSIHKSISEKKHLCEKSRGLLIEQAKLINRIRRKSL